MTSFNDLTLGQYQALYSIQKAEMDELDKQTECVAILTGKTHREVEDAPVLEYNKAVSELKEIWQKATLDYELKKTIKCGDRTYGITYIPAQLKAGQYIEVQEWMRGDVIDNMHKILASLSYPIVKGKDGVNDPSIHAEVAADFQEALFKDCYPSCVFFCELFSASIRGLESYLESAIMKTRNPNRKEALMTLRLALGGFTPQRMSPTLNEYL